MHSTASSSAFARGEVLTQGRRTMRAGGRQAPIRVGFGILWSMVGCQAQCATRRGQTSLAPVGAAAAAASLFRHPLRATPSLFHLQAHAEGPMIVTEKKELRLPTPKYCESVTQTRRRPTRTVDVRPHPACCLTCGARGLKLAVVDVLLCAVWSDYVYALGAAALRNASASQPPLPPHRLPACRLGPSRWVPSTASRCRP